MAANVNREANLRGGCGAAAGRLRPPAKFSWYPASLVGILDGPFRGRELSLVPRQTSPASADAPTPRKPSNNLFEPFRPLGNLQATCLGLSDPSETFKQLVWAFPTPRKPSNNLFEPFRPLGNLQTTCLSLSDPSEGGQTCAAGRSPPIPPIFAAGYLVYGCVASYPIPCLTTTYYSEITLTTTYNGITVWNRRASQRGEVDLV